MKKLVNGTSVNMSAEEISAYASEAAAMQAARAQVAYKHARAEAYPPMADYLDAVVKISSGDEALQAEGAAQLEAYCAACLAVKAAYPKPLEAE